MPHELLSYIFPPFLVLFWYLLKQKDYLQEKKIESLEAKISSEVKLLQLKHENNIKELAELRVQIADGHYKKNELDEKFIEIKESIRDSFNVLGNKFDKLSDALMHHVTVEDPRRSR